MKIKFIDSKNRIRSVLTDGNPQQCYEDAVFEYSEKYGKTFAREMSGFLKEIPAERIKNAKAEISSKTGTPENEIRNKEVITGDTALLAEYLRYLDTNFASEKKIIKLFKWNENFTRNFNNRSQYDPNKLVTYNSIAENFSKLGLKNYYETVEEEAKVATLFNGEVVVYKICSVYLEGTEESFDKLIDLIREKCIASLKGAEGGKSGDYSKSEYKHAIEEIEKEYENNIQPILKEIDKFTEALNNGDYEDDEEKQEIIDVIEEDKEELKHLEELHNIQLENEKNNFEGNVDFVLTNEDIKKVCLFETDDAEEVEVPSAQEFSRRYPLTKDSKNWFGAKDVKLRFNFEKTKLIRDGKVFDYFKVNKELEKHYYDSKENISYEKWLSQNSDLINDTLTKLEKGGKPMNDSLKNLKFRFKDGIEIEVLDSEGKDFKEVKDEAIQVHRQIVKKCVKDSVESENQLETEETLEKYNAIPSNEVQENEEKPTHVSLLGFSLNVMLQRAEKAIREGVSKEEWVNSQLEESPEFDKFFNLNDIYDYEFAEINGENETQVEDSIEETSNDKYQVIVNGKEIGIYDTLEEAEEAEKKALEAVEKGIPKVEVEDEDTSCEVKDDAEQAAYENAKECLYYGVSKADWDSCGLPEEKANEIWKKAFKDLAEEM